MKQVVSDASRDKRKQKARKQNGGHPREKHYLKCTIKVYHYSIIGLTFGLI